MTGSLSPYPLVRQGDSGHPVKTLQDLLNQHGSSLAVDGIFGPATDAAVRAFQQANSLSVDGIAGPHTFGALVVTVQRGSTGDAVKGVQEEIEFRNESGLPGLAIDGIFGPQTEAAVRGFQEALHAGDSTIAVDGIVGPITWQALISGMYSG